MTTNIAAEKQFALRLPKAFEGTGRPLLVINWNAGAFSALDELVREQAHVLVVEEALVILIVCAFIQGFRTRFLRGNGFTSVGVVHLHAHFPCLCAGNPADRETGSGFKRCAVVRA